MSDDEPIDEVVSFTTMDEAIAVATGEDCSCEPLVLQVGAKA